MRGRGCVRADSCRPVEHISSRTSQGVRTSDRGRANAERWLAHRLQLVARVTSTRVRTRLRTRARRRPTVSVKARSKSDLACAGVMIGFPPHMSVRASHRARSARTTLANVRSRPVGRPNARLVQMRPPLRGYALPRARSWRARTCSAANAGERAAQHVSRPALSPRAHRCT
jgi:hypothetical protein